MSKITGIKSLVNILLLIKRRVGVLGLCLACFVLFAHSESASKQNVSETVDGYGTVLKIDSMLAEFNSLSDYNSANQFFSILYDSGFAQERYNFPQETPTDSLRAQVWYWAAEYYYDCQLYETALDYALKALPLYKGIEGINSEADVLQLVAVIYFRLSDYDNAIRYEKKCYEIDLKGGNPDNISSSLNTIASIYIAAKMPEKAEKYVLKAITYCEKANNQYRLAVIYGVASEMYHTMGNNKLSLEYSTKAYRLEQKLGRTEKMAIRQSQMATAQIALGKMQEAKANIEKTIPIFEEYNNAHSLAISYKQMGTVLRSESNDSLALIYFNKALDIFVQQHDMYNEASVRKALYDILRNSDPASALVHNDRYNELRDSIYKRDTNNSLSAFEVEYENSELQQQNEDMRALMHNLNLLILLILIFFAAVFVFSWRYFKRNENKRNQNIEVIKATIPNLSASTEEQKEDAPSEEEIEEPDVLFMQRLNAAVSTIKLSELTVDTLASAMHLHPQTLRRRMITITGKLPKAYITDLKIEKACELLKTNKDMLVADVALQSGFAEPSSFVRTFRQKYGITPSQYREQFIK